MKPFSEYYTEAERKEYEFKIKMACIEVTDDVLDRIERALKKFDLLRLSKAKTLPIGSSLDFPAFGTACEVSLMTAALKYPCTDDEVRTAIANNGGFPLANIRVIPATCAEEAMRELDAELKDAEYKTLLGNDYEKSTGAEQEQVGQKRVDSLLKQLHYRKYDGPKESNNTTTNDLPQGTTSPVGSAGTLQKRAAR